MRHNNGHGLSMLSGIVLGAGVMALLDPGRGASRRAFLRNKLVHWSRLGIRELRRKVKYYSQDTYGQIQEKWARAKETPVPDDVLEERVKAQIGHVLSHHSVKVRADNGHVTVDGPVMMGETDKLADRLRVTRGVRSFDLFVTEHRKGEHVSNLQGRSPAIKTA